MLHQLEANVLVPKIMERRVGVSPVAVMVALLVGGALWGIVGAILAIPTAAILSVIVEDIAASHQIRIQRVPLTSGAQSLALRHAQDKQYEHAHGELVEP